MKVPLYLKLDLLERYMSEEIFLHNSRVNDYQLSFSILVNKSLWNQSGDISNIDIFFTLLPLLSSKC